MQDQPDGFAGGKPVQDVDLLASQQALSRRINTAQTMLVEIQRIIQAGNLAILEYDHRGPSTPSQQDDLIA
ncbi:hypothetical protein NS337_13845 [Pseudomonas oryzihabitans]|nr:hypothetical protein NS337_13845 [Pseudomonas psychrotolerans]